MTEVHQTSNLDPVFKVFTIYRKNEMITNQLHD